ncbi:MAG: helix-turn-helix transcriptional regulator [Devosia sp.]|jgi:transcriptional regulator with XRE-family HTH domain|uniref:helix-turn-helix domain-containing protein n=1 Tax=Devosia sp. TaxID=1871048 RepID=UPI001A52A0AD|nr:XRE family transcriptional regulator [Devosia sp.]MBL8598060.1 helix-turn-helix transcriptional regulator [Devosia sp.]
MDADDIREMSESFVTSGESLGARLRARRKAIGKTMQQVADEASLTIGFISQIERGISTPSLASLYNVSKALDASVDMFVSRAPARSHSVVSHAGQRPTFKVDGTSRFYEFLERGFADAKLNACLSHVPPGYASDMMSHEGEDFVYLVAGFMLYEVDGATYELRAGDTLHFDSRRPHRGTNIGGETAIELWVGTMRLFPE